MPFVVPWYHTMVTVAFRRRPREKADFPQRKMAVTTHNLTAAVLDFGLKIFGSEDELQRVVLANAVRETVRMPGLRHGEDVNFSVWHMAADKNWRIGTSDRFVHDCVRGSKTCQASLRRSDGLYLEIGANIGLATVCAAKLFPTLQIVSVEASPINAFLHRWNLDANDLSSANRSTIHAAMVGSTQNSANLNFIDCGAVLARTSRVAEDHENSLPPGCISASVPVITLSSVLETQTAPRITLMRQDCEGCEMSTLPAWQEAGLLERIDHYTGEFHQRMARTAEEAATARSVLCNQSSHTHFLQWTPAKCAVPLLVRSPPPSPLPPSPLPPNAKLQAG